MPRSRRWGFRLAALALPFLGLVGLELALRLFGYGYPTEFFLRDEIHGQPVLTENLDFTRRFFPPGLERTPEPLVMAARKPAGAIRIFIFGESAAQGDPEPSFALARILEKLLQARWPGKSIEVINVAITAINSHVIRYIARDCAPRQGDVWIIYMGNNEVVGPFGAGTVFGAQTPGLGFIRARVGLQGLRMGQALNALQWRLTSGRTPAVWAGMEMFLKQQVPRADPRMAVVYAHFQKNLDAILNSAGHAGAQVLLSTVASNLKDCPPFASQHRPGLTGDALADWQQHFQAGTNQEAAGNFSGALAAYQQAVKRDDQYAELWFRLGRCREALRQYAEARQCFQQARDLDTLRFRADSRINQIIRQTATHPARAGVQLVDAVDIFAQHSPHGIAGNELFYEHVHPNFPGHYRLARAFAEQLEPFLAKRLAATAEAPAWLSAADCRRRLANTAWDRIEVMKEVQERLKLPPFTHQLGQARRLQRWRERLALSEAALDRNAIEAAVATYRAAIQLSPADWTLRARFARFSQFNGDPREAERQWRAVMDLIPHYLPAYYSLGNLLDSEGRTTEAIPYFEAALRRRPGLVEARNGLGLALANLGRLKAAQRQYELAVRRRPDFAEAHVNLGQMLARQGRTDAARAQYELALRYRPNSAAAHINLGKLLAAEGRLPEAAHHYREAIRIKPGNAIAHYNLGNALSAMNGPDALEEYQQAVTLAPKFTEARYNLAMALAQAGRTREALVQLQEVARAQPDSAEVQSNLGVALAKLGRYAEAIPHFQKALQLDPNHPTARKFLEQAQALKP